MLMYLIFFPLNYLQEDDTRKYNSGKFPVIYSRIPACQNLRIILYRAKICVLFRRWNFVPHLIYHTHTHTHTHTYIYIYIHAHTLNWEWQRRAREKVWIEQKLPRPSESCFLQSVETCVDQKLSNTATERRA